jgi:hypothetical protein
MIGPKIIKIVLSLPLMLALFWSGESCESKTMSVALMDAKSVKLGTWGGDHVVLQMTKKGASLDYDCAHGTIDRRLSTDRRGNFKARGTHYRERGGPVHAGDSQKGEPASYTGRINGNTMTLTVTLTDTNETIGTFTLAYGKEGRVMKCK